MKVILFGATGMVGQGVLRECLCDDSVNRVLAINRNSIGRTHSGRCTSLTIYQVGNTDYDRPVNM